MLLGQENPSSAPTYLLRLERMEALSDVCVLVRSDGPYHLEKNDGDKVDVYEGNLPEGDVPKLQRWVSANELFTLTQDKIIAPVFSSGKNELVVAVHRPGYWQNLDFPAPSTWQPLHQSVVPLAQWFDELLKAKHRVKLKEEEARSNCIPHHELKFSTREPAPAAPPKPDFLFILHDTTIENQFGKKVCTIVYRDGQFHRETKAQKMGSTDITTATYDGKLDPADLTQLQAILEKPELQNRRTPLLPSGGYMKEGEIVSVTTPGEAKPRTVLFWNYVPAGLVSGKIYDENGMKDLAPLAQWLKTAVDSQKERPTPNGSLTDCVPMVQPSARSH
jgi:hypothetical protein